MITSRLAVILAERRIAGNEPYTISALSDATGLHRDTISRLVNNTSERVSLDVLDAICRVLDMQVGDVLVYVPAKPFQTEDDNP